MDEILYNSLNTYFKTISAYGYRDYSAVYKILVTDFLSEFTKSFKEILTPEDRLLIQDLLYSFFETTCEIPAPGRDCNCQEPPEPVIDILTEFKLIPSVTTYTGTQSVTFTGAQVKINTAESLKPNSLCIFWDNDIMVSNLPNNEVTAFNPKVTKTLVENNQYIAKARIEDLQGTYYWSNSFTINVKPPRVFKYMYTGVGVTKPTVEEILAGEKYDYNQTKQFTTPAMTQRTIWIALPSDVTLVSMENANFAGDYLYNIATGKDLLTEEDITLNSSPYKLYYLTTIKTNSPYKTIVR